MMLDSLAIAALLRHRPPALLVAHELAGVDGRRRFATVARDEWHWTQLLDAAAQAAGLCVRSDDDALAGRAFVVAAYERVVQVTPPGRWRSGVYTIVVWRLRSFLQMHQFEVRVEGEGEGGPLLAARVTLAPVETS